jgi:DNA-binding NtrC family response regulator
LPPAQKNRRPFALLIVDDWEALERYEEMLSADFEVECAPFFSTGLEFLQSKTVDVILLDLTVEHVSQEEGQALLESMDLKSSLVVVGRDLKRPFTPESLRTTMRARLASSTA